MAISLEGCKKFFITSFLREKNKMTPWTLKMKISTTLTNTLETAMMFVFQSDNSELDIKHILTYVNNFLNSVRRFKLFTHWLVWTRDTSHF